MATNKHAAIRYQALDRCFSNYGRKFFIEDLIKACNNAIFEYAGIEDGVKRRQVFDDITYMESEQGWSIPLDRNKDGRRVYYRYSDRGFSINKQGISQYEVEQLRDTLAILSRFKGLPQFEWIEEVQIRLENSFKLKKSIKAVVGFEGNPYLKGLAFFSDLLNAIQNERVLYIKYKGFRQDKESLIKISPWYLKQYNNRWFLFGFNNEYQTISNMALDRIISFEESIDHFAVNEETDFDEYFDDVIGVTVKEDAPIERIVLKITADVWPYIESKPLHPSQKVRVRDGSYVEVELRLKINHELISTLFSYLDSIEVLEPESLRDRFRVITENIHKKNY
jgi:predicted DNA-binding transcriptional regulator YafY